MAYKCLECGHIFEEGEQNVWNENRGEFWGIPCIEKMTGCPMCSGVYKETTRCASCGSEHIDDELIGGVCEKCIDERRKDFDFCYKIAVCEEEIKINSLLAKLICKSDIEAILVDYIKKKMPDIDCSQFIDEDIVWFGEKIAEEVKKNENGKK